MFALNQSKLKELLNYNPENGSFTWLKSQGNASKGSKAGSLAVNGYILIAVNGQRYRAHRLAFLYMKARFPVLDIDHINRNPSDNRWVNLREVSRAVGGVGGDGHNQPYGCGAQDGFFENVRHNTHIAPLACGRKWKKVGRLTP